MERFLFENVVTLKRRVLASVQMIKLAYEISKNQKKKFRFRLCILKDAIKLHFSRRIHEKIPFTTGFRCQTGIYFCTFYCSLFLHNFPTLCWPKSFFRNSCDTFLINKASLSENKNLLPTLWQHLQKIHATNTKCIL